MSQQTDLSPALALSIDLVFGIVKRTVRAEELLESARGQTEALREHYFQTECQRVARIKELETALAAANAQIEQLRKAGASDLRIGDTVEIVANWPNDPPIGYRGEIVALDPGDDGNVHILYPASPSGKYCMLRREVKRVASPQQASKPLAVLPSYCERLPDDELGPVVRTLTYPKTRIEINDPHGAELCITQEDEGTFTLDIPALRAYLALIPVRGDSPA
jgi:type II secretory pathway pseudopilin PulG